MAVCWVILRGKQIYSVIQAVHSLLYIVAKCHFFSVVTWKDIIKYLHTHIYIWAFIVLGYCCPWRVWELSEFIKNILICVCGGGITDLERRWGWVINDWIFIFGWTIPLNGLQMAHACTFLSVAITSAFFCKIWVVTCTELSSSRACRHFSMSYGLKGSRRRIMIPGDSHIT